MSEIKKGGQVMRKDIRSVNQSVIQLKKKGREGREKRKKIKDKGGLTESE